MPEYTSISAIQKDFLFTAKRSDNNELVLGYVFVINNKTYITDIPKSFLTTAYNQESVVDFNIRAYEVLPDTIQKYYQK